MAKLTVVVGLPGSGKSTYLKNLKSSGKISDYIEDYQSEAFNNHGDPHLSKNYGPLLAALQAGKNIGVADIIFCDRKARHAFLAAILAVVPETELESCYFENNPELCARNVRARARPDRVEREVEFIQAYSPQYVVPSLTTLEVKSDEPK